MAPCTYFLEGRCRFGNLCHNSHDTLTANSSEETEVQGGSGADLADCPPSQSAEGSSVADVHPPPATAVQAPIPLPCRYFASGHCKNGASSRYQHVTQGDSASIESQEKAQMRDGQPPRTDDTSYLVEFNSARVTFKSGFEVSNVRLGSDFSTIELVNLPASVEAQAVVEILSEADVNVSESAVHIKPGSHLSRASISFDDPNSARLAAQKVRYGYGRCFGIIDGAISTLTTHAASKYAVYLDMCGVNCIWYRPARRAIISLDTLQQARDVKQHIERFPTVQGRHIVVMGPAGSERRPVLKLSDLHPETQEEDLQELIKSVTKTAHIDMKPPTCNLKDEDLGDHVKRLLNDSRGLLTFGPVQVLPDGRHMKAVAGFIDSTSAVRAVQALHDKRFDNIGNVRLMLERVLCISYHVHTAIFHAVQPQLEGLCNEARASRHAVIHLQIGKDRGALSIIRFRTTSEDVIVQFNASIEKLFEGEVLLNGDSLLWHPWFVSTRGIASINKVATVNQVYIHRELHRSRLRLYGGTPASKPAIVRLLLEELESATNRIHSIPLDEEMVFRVTNGGLDRLREKFRNTVHLSRTGGPAGTPTIILYGTAEDAQVARSLVVEYTSPTQQKFKVDDCPICLGPVTDSVRLSCGHGYCRDCFCHALDSAVHRLPFKCFGNEGKCDHTCGIKEVVDVISYSRSEKLFADIFTAYIRRHPEELRSCPTADCPSLYRPSKDGMVFRCYKCLAPVCTTCHVVEHTGITCAEYQEFHADGGARALAQYRAENDVRDCPKCLVAIEKDDGCMHVQCRSCYAHICWVCMQWFDRGHNGGHHECYAHMVTTHGGIYNHENPVYAPDPESSEDEDDEGEDEGEAEAEVEGGNEVHHEGGDEGRLERVRENEGAGALDPNGGAEAWAEWDAVFGDENQQPPEDESNEGDGWMEDEAAWMMGEEAVQAGVI